MHFLKWDKSTLPYVSHCAPLWDRDGGDTMFVCLFPPQPNTQMPNFALKSFIHQFQCCMQGPVTTAGKVRKPLWFSVMRSRGHHVMLIFLLCLSPGVITIWSNCIGTVPLTQLDNIPVRSLVHVRFSVPGCVTQKLTVNIPSGVSPAQSWHFNACCTAMLQTAALSPRILFSCLHLLLFAPL